MRWKLRSSGVPTSIDEAVQQVLFNRGLHDANHVQEFLEPQHPKTLTLQEVGIDPLEMQKALDLLAMAKESGEKVVVFGDYDADGICATAVVWETLHASGFHALPFIPDRRKHGYGLSQAAIAELLADPEPPQMVITVDNGIVAHAAIAQLREAGISVILTDHHQPDALGYPEADAVVHTTKLCGTTVGWMLAHALAPDLAQSKLDLTAIATIADQVELFEANRSFAVFGLEALRRTNRPGLLGLLQIANVDPERLDERSVNYGLAPRINAMGRLENPLDALRALCTTNPTRATDLTNKLQQTNITRQEITSEMMESAEAIALEQADQRIVVIASDRYHEGVIGLVAGRLAERFSKPAVVIALGELHGKGSARSVAGVHITELLRTVREELLDIGGHPMAAGFSLRLDAVEVFTQKLQAAALRLVAPEQLEPALELDAVLPASLLHLQLVELLQQCAPFGAGNPAPMFAVEGLTLKAVEPVGAERQHRRFRFINESGTEVQGIAFRVGDAFDAVPLNIPVQVAGQVQDNEWKGRHTLQLKVQDVRLKSDGLSA